MDRIKNPQATRDNNDHLSLVFGLHRLRAKIPFANKTTILLDRLADWSLASLVFVAPLFMAGRHPWGQLVFVTCVIIGSLAWSLGQILRPQPIFQRSGAEPLFLAGVCLLIIQCVPLPGILCNFISPTLNELLSTWTAPISHQMQFGEWPFLTIAPMVTRSALVMFASYCLLFLLVVQRIHHMTDVETLLRWLALATLTMGILGISQYLVGNGKFLWIYESPFRNTWLAAKGTFANENHFAHFLALGVGPLIWWTTHRAQQKEQPTIRPFTKTEKRTFKGLAWLGAPLSLGIVTFGSFLAFSRAGVLVVLISIFMVGGLYASQKILTRNLLLTAATAIVLGTAALLIHGYDHLIRQFSSLHSWSWNDLSAAFSRGEIWAANWKAFTDFSWIGTGGGTHRYSYPMYFQSPSDVEYTHAESGYLQILSETGVFGFCILLCSLLLVARWCMHGFRHLKLTQDIACWGAVTGSLVVSVVHSLVDFVWYIPACATVTAILTACACRIYQLSLADSKKVEPGTTVSYSKSVLWTTILAFLSAAMVANRLPPALAAASWDRYLRLSFAEQERSKEEIIEVSESKPIDDATARFSVVRTEQMAKELRYILKLCPYDTRANLRMSAIYLREFEQKQQFADNALGLNSIRDAALASKFESREGLDQWLTVAVGDNRHKLEMAAHYARRAIYLCPLQGDGYVYLGDLCFLQGMGNSHKSMLTQQALRVRPYKGSVLLAAAQEASMRGDIQQALTYWQKTFHRETSYRQIVIESLSDLLPVELVVRTLKPEADDLISMFTYYYDARQYEPARYIAKQYQARLQRDPPSHTSEKIAKSWKTAYWLHFQVKNNESAIACLRQAIRITPEDLTWRKTLAMALVHAGKNTESLQHLRWCLRRRPDDQELQNAYRLAQHGTATDLQ